MTRQTRLARNLVCLLCQTALPFKCSERGSIMISLASGVVDIWWASTRDAASHLEGLLDDTERKRYLAYRTNAARQRFLVGCSLSKCVLASYLGCAASDVRFSRKCLRCGQPHGKPEISKPVVKKGGICFSISHSGDVIGVAVTLETQIGLDVEYLSADLDVSSIANLTLSNGELAAMDSNSTVEDFLAVWTRKEAVVKAVGMAFQTSPNAVEVSPAKSVPKLLGWPFDMPQEPVCLFDVEVAPDHIASLATLGPCWTINYRDGSSVLACAMPPLLGYH